MHRTLTQEGKRRRERLEHSDESKKKEAHGNDEFPIKNTNPGMSASEVCSAVLELCMQKWKYK